MKHLGFFFVIGFSVAGFVMLYVGLSTLFSMVVHGSDPFNAFVLVSAMLLPFVIATLSWRDWRRVQAKEDTHGRSLKAPAGVLWMARPWILPGMLARSVLFVLVAAGVSWLEFSFGFAQVTVLNVQMVLWADLVIFLGWMFSLAPLLLLRAANMYVLRNDGLEVRTGILTSKSCVIAPSGFSDMEVARSISGRVMNMGDIIVRTQGDSDVRIVKVRNPLRVADQIRGVMARPTVRIEGQEQIIR